MEEMLFSIIIIIIIKIIQVQRRENITSATAGWLNTIQNYYWM